FFELPQIYDLVHVSISTRASDWMISDHDTYFLRNASNETTSAEGLDSSSEPSSVEFASFSFVEDFRVFDFDFCGFSTVSSVGIISIEVTSAPSSLSLTG